MKKVWGNIFFYLIFFLSFLVIFSSTWVSDTFGLLNIDSLLFHITNPLQGTESGMIISFIIRPLLQSVIATFISVIIFNHKYIYKVYINLKFFKHNKNNIDFFKFLREKRILLSIVFLIIVISLTLMKFGAFEYLKDMLNYSKFVEENYVDPKYAKIEFPEEKRNLIYIILESMEFTYADEENGGVFEENLIPYLTEYANEEISFRNKNNGGFYHSRGTGWTIAAMVAQSAGISFITQGVGSNDFLPGAYSLGDILKNEGYNQTLLIGSDATFASRNLYYEQHGSYTIKDYEYAKEVEWIPEDYHEWWGYEDSKLFEFAKYELEELSSKNEPFNVTLLTTNTHHIGGYLEDDCELKYDDQFKNVIACSDKQVYEFIEWVKKQDYYENTTIVIAGDHLSMDPDFFNDLDEDYERTNYNVFINSAKEANKTSNRQFYAQDMYPTILSSMGVKINGDRLGIGTNLFSSSKTIYEEFGRKYVNRELKKNSKFYKSHILGE